MTTNKIIDETWTTHTDIGYGATYVETQDVDDTICVEDPAKAALIAQAPGMARLLMAYAFSGSEWECPSCEGDLFPLAGGPLDVRAERHDPDCKLIAVLRAAEVIA